MNKYAEMIPIEYCQNHDYVFLSRETIITTEPHIRLIPKETYACIHCGLGMDFYNLADKIDVNRNE